MSKPVTYQWIAAASSAIAAVQTLGAAGDLNLNGTQVFQPNPSSPITAAQFTNISRTVKISSVNNLSAVNFKVTGTLNGVVVSETIAGPNVGNVSTTQIFQTVTKVHADAAAAAVIVGTGQTGQTNYFAYDFNRITPVASMNIAVTGVITYEVHCTSGDPSSGTFVDTIVMPASLISQAIVLEGVVSYYWIKITASTGGATLTAEIAQQGL